MKNLMLINTLAILALAFLALPAFAGEKVIFGGDLDRPTSTYHADLREGANDPTDEEVPEEPDDEEPEDPKIFLDEEIPGHTIVLALDRSGSMSSTYSAGIPIYDGNGNLIPYPSRWQAIQSETANLVGMLDEEEDSFDLVTYETNVYVCFGELRKATRDAKAQAVAWIYAQGTAGCTNSYDALRASFNNYGKLDTIIFMSDGYPNTALSLGCSACSCASWIGSRILSDVRAWLQAQVSMSQGFTFLVFQMGGSPMPLMVQLGQLPNSTFRLR